MISGYCIIDAHCHPIAMTGDSLTNHYGSPATAEEYFAEERSFGVDFCCGSVILSSHGVPEEFSAFTRLNAAALELQRRHPDFCMGGIHVHPKFVRESVAALQAFRAAGNVWVGELVPYHFGFDSYSSPEMLEIFAAARDLGLVVNLHPTSDADIARLLDNLPGLPVVVAHPGETGMLPARAEMMKKYPDLYWDICGTGLFRWGMLRYLVEQCGEHKLLFGTDFPICSVPMQIYGVLGERISDTARRAIFSENFRRLTRRNNCKETL